MRPVPRFTLLALLAIAAGCSTDDGPPPDDDDATTPAPNDDDSAQGDDDDSAQGDDDDSAQGDDDDATTPPPPGLPTWDDAPCDALGQLASGGFQAAVDRWGAQVDEVPFEAGRVVFAGSSSMRLWERLLEDLSAWSPIQRGFGGSRLWDVAEHSGQLITRHDPSAVVVFAGTNDIAAGLSADEVLAGYRCLVERVADDLGDRPIAFVAITPTPARWASWAQASAVNDGVAALAAEWPDLHFIDTTEAFLQTGAPPDASLFRADGLHLSAAGYALWTALIRPQLASFAPAVLPTVTPLAPGTRILVDLGPSNPEDGEPTVSPDGSGLHWNNWHPMEGQSEMLPGEQRGALVDVTGTPTSVRLVLSSNMTSNGILNGGLLTPDAQLLGDLAVATATEDYVWLEAGDTGAIALEGLDPSARFGLRLFASRAASETRITRYTVSGANGRETRDLPVSGAGLGGGSYDGNTGSVAAFSGLAPDAYGRLHLDYSALQGAFAYLGILELTVQ